jgi:hypothetical protein
MCIRPHSLAGWSLASICLCEYFSRILSDIVISLSIICEETTNLFWVLGELLVTSQILHHLLMHSSKV